MRQLLVIVIAAVTLSCAPEKDRVMTVNGWLEADAMSTTLPHEHVLVDFIGADSIRPGRYNADSAFARALPFVKEFRTGGGQTIIECTPAWLGRDPLLLARLSESTGVNFITNTGYYGAAKEKFLPRHAFTESAAQLADRWINEWNNGIADTGIRPGFMKLGADKGPLTDTQAKTIHAAAIAHLQTGLTIAVHTGDGAAALEELSILEEHGVAADAFVWVHAQNEKDSTIHEKLAKQGVWIEFDGLNEENLGVYVGYIKHARAAGFLDKILISHDAGWYHVGEPNGGSYRDYLTLGSKLVPMLLEQGISPTDVTAITAINPAKAFAIRIRKKK